MEQTVFKSPAPVRPLGAAVLGATASVGATSLTLTAGGGATLGTDYPYRAVLFSATNPDVNETVVVTGATGDVVDLDSALVGNWASGGPVWRMVVTADFTDLHTAVNAVEAAMDSGVMTSLDVEEDGAIGGDLDVTGAVTATGGLVVADGSLEALGVQFAGATTTGIYRDPGNGNVYIVIGGAWAKSFAAGQDITVRYADAPKFKGARIQGTVGSPADTADTHVLFDIVGMGYANGASRDTAVVRIIQDGAVSGNYVPAAIHLVARNSSGTAVTVLRARASGALEVPGALKHEGSTAGFFNTSPVSRPAITGWSSKTDAQKVEALKDALVALGLVSVS